MKANSRAAQLRALGLPKATWRYALLVEVLMPCGCWAARATLAELYGCDESQIRRMHRELVAAGAWAPASGRGFRFVADESGAESGDSTGSTTPAPGDPPGSPAPGSDCEDPVDNSPTRGFYPGAQLPPPGNPPGAGRTANGSRTHKNREHSSHARERRERESSRRARASARAAAAEPSDSSEPEPWVAMLADRLRLRGDRLREVAAEVRREASAGGLVEARLVEDLVRWAAAKRSPAGAVIDLARQGALLDAQQRACREPGPHDAPEVEFDHALLQRVLGARREDPDELRPATVEAVEALAREVERWPRNARVAGLTASEADNLREQVRQRRARQAGAARMAGGAA